MSCESPQKPLPLLRMIVFLFVFHQYLCIFAVKLKELDDETDIVIHIYIVSL